MPERYETCGWQDEQTGVTETDQPGPRGDIRAKDKPSGIKGLKSTLDRGGMVKRENLVTHAHHIFSVNNIGAKHNPCSLGS